MITNQKRTDRFFFGNLFEFPLSLVPVTALYRRFQRDQHEMELGCGVLLRRQGCKTLIVKRKKQRRNQRAIVTWWRRNLES